MTEVEVRERDSEGAVLLALNLGEGFKNQGMQVTSRSWKKCK